MVWEPWLGERSQFTYSGQQLDDHLQAHVNVANGNLVLHQQAEQIRGTGLNLVADAVFNDQSDVTYGLGYRWNLSTGYDVSLHVYYDGSVSLYGPSGYEVPFFINPDGSFTSPSGLDASLVKNGDSTYTLTFHASGEQWKFNSSGYFTSDVDKNGNTISFAYNGSNQLTSITDTQGRVTTVTWNGSSISQLTDSSGRTYKWTSSGGKVTKYTDPNNKSTSYGYDTSGNQNLNQITDPNGTVTKLVYDMSTAGDVHHLRLRQQRGRDVGLQPTTPATPWSRTPTTTPPPTTTMCMAG